MGKESERQLLLYRWGHCFLSHSNAIVESFFITHTAVFQISVLVLMFLTFIV